MNLTNLPIDILWNCLVYYLNNYQDALIISKVSKYFKQFIRQPGIVSHIWLDAFDTPAIARAIQNTSNHWERCTIRNSQPNQPSSILLAFRTSLKNVIIQSNTSILALSPLSDTAILEQLHLSYTDTLAKSDLALFIHYLPLQNLQYSGILNSGLIFALPRTIQTLSATISSNRDLQRLARRVPHLKDLSVRLLASRTMYDTSAFRRLRSIKLNGGTGSIKLPQTLKTLIFLNSEFTLFCSTSIQLEVLELIGTYSETLTLTIVRMTNPTFIILKNCGFSSEFIKMLKEASIQVLHK